MALISIDNGAHFVSVEEAIAGADWDTIVNFMDDDTRETVHDAFASSSREDFLRRYLELAEEDLIIG